MSIELQETRRRDGAPNSPEVLPVTEPDGTFMDEPKSLSLANLRPVDRLNFYFLTMLYFLQGVPVGLAFGSIPFLLKEHLSYAQVGVFSFASYPYSLKLLWSPIVDGFFITSVGRRRSWIIPIQLFSSVVLIGISSVAENWITHADTNLGIITIAFGTLVFACATQDIAVDGWALTLLSADALPYASTAQTIGLNTGYFTSFTVFLALSSPEFANKYFRRNPNPSAGLVSLNQYLFWCGILYVLVTLFVTFGKSEERPRRSAHKDGVISIYRTMISVLRLPSLRSLVVVHLLAKVAFQAAEAVTNLKLIERGLSKEDLALVVLIDFPFEIIFGYYAAKWSMGRTPLRPWMWAYMGRIAYACVSMSQVMWYPRRGTTPLYLAYVILVHVIGSFLSTVQFVSITAFHTQIADPEIGGTYMTVLNTLANLGGQWPRFLVMVGVDWFTSATCSVNGESCAKQDTKTACETAGGICHVHRDGYYVMNVTCIIIGLLLYSGYIRKTLLRLQRLPTSAWRK